MTDKVLYKWKIHSDRLAQKLWPGSSHDQCTFRSATLQGTLQGEIRMSCFSRYRRTMEYLWLDVLQGLAQTLTSQHPIWGTSSYCWLLFTFHWMFCPYYLCRNLCMITCVFPTCDKCVYIIVTVCHPCLQVTVWVWLLEFHALLFTRGILNIPSCALRPLSVIYYPPFSHHQYQWIIH